ncbi:MAG: hypothetical protein AB7W16_23395 [Candidatus Obscuribacterales bacterium]
MSKTIISSFGGIGGISRKIIYSMLAVVLTSILGSLPPVFCYGMVGISKTPGRQATSRAVQCLGSSGYAARSGSAAS